MMKVTRDLGVSELAPPLYSDEERVRVVDFVMALRADQVRGLLKEHELPVSGTKSDLRERIREAL